MKITPQSQSLGAIYNCKQVRNYSFGLCHSGVEAWELQVRLFMKYLAGGSENRGNGWNFLWRGKVKNLQRTLTTYQLHKRPFGILCTLHVDEKLSEYFKREVLIRISCIQGDYRMRIVRFFTITSIVLVSKFQAQWSDLN